LVILVAAIGSACLPPFFDRFILTQETTTKQRPSLAAAAASAGKRLPTVHLTPLAGLEQPDAIRVLVSELRLLPGTALVVVWRAIVLFLTSLASRLRPSCLRPALGLALADPAGPAWVTAKST
jgi:hypothetical protein